MSEKKPHSIDVEAAWIDRLADILTAKGLTEIEIEKDDVRLRVSRAAPASAIAYAAAPPAPLAPDAPRADPVPSAKSSKLAGAVTSPMVGTAYLRPSPEAPPFVNPGDRVAEGQTLLIIEAMKTMNPITASRAGVVKDILVKDAQPVEFGESLLVLE